MRPFVWKDGDAICQQRTIALTQHGYEDLNRFFVPNASAMISSLKQLRKKQKRAAHINISAPQRKSGNIPTVRKTANCV